jgi:hypothetical protein
MNPADLLDSLVQKYARCRSYWDKGFVQFDDWEGKTQLLHFRTFYASPNKLRFEWQDYGPNRGKSESFSLLCWDGCETILDLQFQKESVSNIGSAIAQATGCSAGAAGGIPQLLITELGNCPWLRLTKLESIGVEKLKDIPCDVLRGHWFNDDQFTLWIGQDGSGLFKVLRDGPAHPSLGKGARTRHAYTFLSTGFDDELDPNIFSEHWSLRSD